MRGKAALWGLLAWLACAGLAQAAAWKLEVIPGVLAQGQTALVRVQGGGSDQPPSLRFLSESTVMAKGKGGWWLGVIGADLDTPEGSHGLEVLVRGQVTAKAPVRVSKKDYGTRHITVARQYVEPAPEELQRHQDDTQAQRAVYAGRLPRMLWQGSWQKPMNSEVVGVFGRRSLVNGQARSPHGGVDLKGALGTPVRAPAGGQVALVRDTFMSGQVVLIDHGLGMITAYRHLSQAKVKLGQEVQRGQVIGLVGATGRVTGPHLHFDLRVLGARVDPLAWIEQSKQLGVTMGSE